ncbi:MAG TPA: NTP transferase domain-containing protein [Mycobacteriales bacterium]|nr:NTP transferase domain-containing protein [Mycobacteriales bacterium]
MTTDPSAPTRFAAAVRYDAVVLAGGHGRRMGGAVKPALTVGGRRLVDIALDAVAEASITVAVGAAIPTSRPVEWVRETPVGSGPVAALAAALPLLRAPVVVVLAADLPFITTAAVDQLLAATGEAGAVVAIDSDGRDQPLIGCYDAAALRAVMPAEPQDVSMRSVLSDLAARAEIVRVDLGGDPPATWDCDTAADLARAQELA